MIRVALPFRAWSQAVDRGDLPALRKACLELERRGNAAMRATLFELLTRGYTVVDLDELGGRP